ncbi:hypothetical protein SRHO_G00217230 [Serrasalmus rhombeus]
MVGNGGMYAVKKRKRPLQKILNAVNHDDAKSTPSKRHRDRLNGELDKLTALLPFSEDVRGRLDKLSILRLSVGYLKLKKFLQDSTFATLAVIFLMRRGPAVEKLSDL